MRPPWALWLVGLVAAVLLMAGSWWLTRGDRTPWDGVVAVEGSTVRLEYTGSDCRDDVRLDVDEGDDDVVVTVYEVVLTSGCNDVGVPYEVEAVLDAPLGDRTLVDGACRDPDLAQRPACQDGVGD